MRLEKIFEGKKNEFIDSVNRWLAGSHVDKIDDNHYEIYDGYTDDPAICTFNENQSECYIKTAFSGFLYTLIVKENDDIKVIYKGAWYGLGKQEIIPEFLKDINWSESRATTSLAKEDLTFEEYKRIREEENEIRYTLHKKYEDQNMTGYRPGLECSDEQLDEVFSQYKNWEYIIIPLSEDPFHQWDSNEYSWEKIVFIHMKRKTPFHMYRKVKK